MKDIIEKAKNIKLFISDVDGVLTDGHMYLADSGTQLKAYHFHDGIGLKLLLNSGLEVGVISGSNTHIITNRMKSLGIPHVYQGQLNKTSAYEDLLQKLSLSDEQVAYIGDDIPDLALIERCGLGIAVANALPIVKEQADWVTEKPGGHGAVREACDLIIHSQGTFERAAKPYL